MHRQGMNCRTLSPGPRNGGKSHHLPSCLPTYIPTCQPILVFCLQVGALCSISGVIVLAMPVAILTESFQQYNLRQKIRQEKRQRQDDFFRRCSTISVTTGRADVFSL